MSPLSAPPPSLDGFPLRTLTRGSLYRIHRARLGPWWFSADGTGRFDLQTASGQGTCYLAEEPIGCFVEVFCDWILVPEREVEARRIAALTLPAEARIADCTAGRAREFGITAEIHSTPDYEITQAWAEAFFAAGFAGIRYFLRQDPEQTLAGLAWFGPAGAPASASGVAADTPIAPEVIEEAISRFGIRVLPTP